MAVHNPYVSSLAVINVPFSNGKQLEFCFQRTLRIPDDGKTYLKF